MSLLMDFANCLAGDGNGDLDAVNVVFPGAPVELVIVVGAVDSVIKAGHLGQRQYINGSIKTFG